jgi:hypothetical protein
MLRLQLILLSAMLQVAFPVYGEGDLQALTTLLAKAPPVVPSGKVIKITGSYSCSTLAGRNNTQIKQKCDDVVFYLSDSKEKRFWITFNQMTSSSLNDPNQLSTFTTSIYSDGTYALRLTQWGDQPDKKGGAQVEISNISEAYDSFSPYASGIGYTLDYLLAPSNRLFGSIISQDNGASKINIKANGDRTSVEMNTVFSSPDGMTTDVSSTTVLSGKEQIFLKSFTRTEVNKLGDQSLEKKEAITVTDSLAVAGGATFPREAQYIQLLRGKENTSYSFTCKSVEVIDQFPSPPPIPPKSDVVDKRLGISVRTGDAPSVIASEIKKYMEQKE